MANKVRCVDCGFLSARDATGIVVEADEPARRQCLFTRAGHVSSFICYRNARQFLPDDVLDQQRLRLAINAEIECAQFKQWQSGKSPQEHEDQDRIAELDRRTTQWRKEDVRDRKLTRLIAVAALLVSIVSVVFAILRKL